MTQDEFMQRCREDIAWRETSEYRRVHREIVKARKLKEKADRIAANDAFIAMMIRG